MLTDGTLPRGSTFREVSVSELTLPRLKAGEIHLFAVGLAPDRARIDAMAGLMGPAERERAARYRFTPHRRRYVVRWGVVRSLLAQHLKCQPTAVRFVHGPAGKPAVKDHPSLHFNLSHSGDLALIAVGRDAPIGVDIEQVRCIEDADAIAQRFFAPREVDVYMSIPERNRRVPFFNSWTRKEAVAKATGDGLSLALDRIEVSMLPGEPARVLAHGSDPEGALGWTLAHVEPASGFVGAVATRRTAVTLRAWSLDLDRTKLIDG